MVGRPRVLDRKVNTSVSIQESKLRKARELGINLGRALEIAIDLAGGMDPDEVELKDLLEMIREMEQQLVPMRARAKLLQENISRKKRLQLDLRIEEDHHAWYLRSMLQEGDIQIKTMLVPKPEIVYQILEERYRVKYEVTGNRVKVLERNPSMLRILEKSWFQRIGADLYEYRQRDPRYVSPTKDEIQQKFISLDYDRFAEDILSGKLHASSPLESFKSYNPRITNKHVSDEVKKRMASFYDSVGIDIESAVENRELVK
ncbi:MAG: hypothetical protein QW292_14880 [Candidatus Parvarchaeota archaeon]